MARKKWCGTQDDKTVTPRIGLGYMPSQPVGISRRHKDKRSFTQHVTAEEAENCKGDNATSCPKSLVFDRLQPSTPHQQPSVFKRIGSDTTFKPSVFRRLQGGKQPKPSVFTRINVGAKSSGSPPVQDEDSVFSRIGELNEVRSSIPSCMKHISTFDVKTDGSLKVNIGTLVISSYVTGSNSKVKIKDQEQPSSHPP